MVKYKIAILGKANSGKDTLCKLIAKNLGLEKHEQCRIAFADPIKKMILDMFPQAEYKYLFGASSLRSEIIPSAFKNKTPLTYRQAVIDVGTLGRSYNEDVWVNKFDQKYEKELKNSNNEAIFVNDGRFSNECKYLKSRDFFIIKLLRDTENKVNHISDTGQDEIKDFDMICDNNGTLSDLKNIINIDILPKIKAIF